MNRIVEIIDYCSDCKYCKYTKPALGDEMCEYKCQLTGEKLWRGKIKYFIPQIEIPDTCPLPETDL